MHYNPENVESTQLEDKEGDMGKCESRIENDKYLLVLLYNDNTSLLKL